MIQICCRGGDGSDVIDYYRSTGQQRPGAARKLVGAAQATSRPQVVGGHWSNRNHTRPGGCFSSHLHWLGQLAELLQ
jgi:hypothetical protein